MKGSPKKLSVVIPVYNECGNIEPLTEEVHAAMKQQGDYEIVIVDDCSVDGTRAELEALATRHDRLRIIQHTTNRGQSAALRSGVKAAAAEVIAAMDGDGQNDPADIPAMLCKLESIEDLRMVVGERVRRHDSWLKLFSSRVANRVRAALLHDGIRDTGCGIKVFYRKDFLDLPAFDHMHRFLPALLQRDGGKVVSMPVNHRPRRYGISKYNLRNRLWVGITDLVGVLWLQKRRL